MRTMARHLNSLAFAENARPAVDTDARVRALERLYRRRELVEDLIRSLESYQTFGSAEFRATAGARTPR